MPVRRSRHGQKAHNLLASKRSCGAGRSNNLARQGLGARFGKKSLLRLMLPVLCGELEEAHTDQRGRYYGVIRIDGSERKITRAHRSPGDSSRTM